MAGSLIDLLVLLGVLAIVIVAGWYVMSQLTLPEPMRKIVMIALVVIVAIIAIILLLRVSGTRIGFADPPPFRVAEGNPAVFGGAFGATSAEAA